MKNNNFENKYNYWLKNSPKNIQEIISKYSKQKIQNNFGEEVSFGTSGIRTKMGYGSSLLNEFTIAKFSLAIAKYLLDKYNIEKIKNGVVVFHDNRNNSLLFSETVAKVLSAKNIPVYLFENNKLQPTPLLSYVLNKEKYILGINITASHNPKEYNGLKVYDENGVSILPNESKKIINYANEIKDIFNIDMNNNLINYLKPSILNNYVNEIFNKVLSNNKNVDYSNVNLIYTSQHGTAIPIAKTLLNKLNVNYQFVKEQMEPDSNFSNTKTANPQDPDAFILSRKYGNKFNADILFSTDPDADRSAIEVRHNNKWVHINGNELPLIQVYFYLNKLKDNNLLTKEYFILKSIVTSNSTDALAKKYGIKSYKTLIGFKWLISEAIKLEKKGLKSILVWEESCGSVIKNFTRDKDSFQSLASVVEIVSEYKKQNKTLVDVLDDIYNEIGFYKSDQDSILINNLNKKHFLQKLGDNLNAFQIGDKFGNYKLTNIIDYFKEYNQLNKNDIIALELDNKHFIYIRQSGTEPILKIYYDILTDSHKSSKRVLSDLRKILKKIIK